MHGQWIGGAFHKSSREGIEIIDPATEEVIDTVTKGSLEDVEKAVAAASDAFYSWKRVSGVRKAELLHEVASKMREMSAALARTLTLEGGKPLRENTDEVGWTAACFDYYAEIGRNYMGRVIPPLEPSQLAMVIKEPYGVAACIIPWNYPLLLMAWKVAPALAAGNTVVIKPSSVTPLSTLALHEAFSILPEGVVNIITGSGEVLGEALIRHRDVRIIAFTGSVEAGRKIAKLASDELKKVHLELGGKDPFVVCEDADLDISARAAAWAAFLNCGQVCTSTERIYVHESVAGEFIERLAGFTRTLRMGPGIEPTTDIGPMAGDSYRRKVEEQIEEARAAGATVVCGGRRPPQFSKGYYLEPAVLTGVNHGMRIMREETFGPVAPVMTFRTFDEAVDLANNSDYGLGACLFTKDPKKVKKFYEEVKSGTIWINDPLTDNDAGPFGGMKLTGGGRELGEEGIEEFRETKHVHWDFEMKAKEWWYPY
jgi:betaine-aldehyde dehydrogenase